MDLAALEDAIRIVEYLKSNLIKLVMEDFVYTKEARVLKDVKQAIAREGTIKHSDLLKSIKMYGPDLLKVLTTLQESEEIEVVMEKTAGRPSRSYRLAR
jgi:hypothetical protein